MIATCAVFATAPLIGEGNVMAFALVCAGDRAGAGLRPVRCRRRSQADIIDEDTAEFIRTALGAVFAAWSLTTKLALALGGVGISFPLLSLFGFEPGTHNAASSLMALAVVYGWVPIVLKGVAIWLDVGVSARRDTAEGAARPHRRRWRRAGYFGFFLIPETSLVPAGRLANEAGWLEHLRQVRAGLQHPGETARENDLEAAALDARDEALGGLVDGHQARHVELCSWPSAAYPRSPD